MGIVNWLFHNPSCKPPAVNDAFSEERDEWVQAFYKRVDQNLSITRQGLLTSHQWAMTLGIGFITALITLDGKGGNFPNELSTFALLLSLPILVRFFIRSCIEYSIQEKFLLLRNELDYYLLSKQDGKSDFERLKTCVQYYYFEWKSPKGLVAIIRENLLLTYRWIFLVYFGIICWGVIKIERTILIYVALLMVLIFLLVEIVGFFNYRAFSYQYWPYKGKIQILSNQSE